MSASFFRIANLPPYPLGDIAESVRDARLEGRDIIDLSQLNPDLKPPPVAVDKLVQATLQPHNHRYSSSQGISAIRQSVAAWYQARYGVQVCADSEVVATLGTKEGLAHLLLAVLSPGETALVPTPSYPMHTAAVFLAGASVTGFQLFNSNDFFERLEKAWSQSWPRARVLIVSFPHNPTTTTVSKSFFERLVPFCKEREIYIIHDFAYADLSYGETKAPSILSVEGAKDIAVESYSLSKGMGLAGWRVGFFLGNPQLISALKRIKSYLDFGAFQPLQIAVSELLSRPKSEIDEIVTETHSQYESRLETLSRGLAELGWEFSAPQATLFVWARIPTQYRKLGSLAMTKKLLEAGVAVCPGEGFDPDARDFVRFSVTEPEQRIRLALEAMRMMSIKDSGETHSAFDANQAQNAANQ
ncbi:UNVERIFIED_CONTAM: hypothetical protein GTU68_058787 [Idotea baltica]|nr:hypothetical protein [Idotea baltica]